MKQILQFSERSVVQARHKLRSVWKFAPLALSLGIVCSIVPSVVQAQSVSISIAAQSLEDALLQWGQQTSLQLLYDSNLVRNLRAPAVSGILTPEQALNQLLVGSDLVFRREGDDIYLSRSLTEPSAQLGLVVVKGTHDSSTEGSGSYTATGPSSTSAGLDLSLRETPQSVSVMTSQRMKDQNLSTLLEVAQQTAGISVQPTGNDGASSSIYSRGFAIDSYMVNGVKLQSNYNSMFQTQDMALYDRVEIVRGASGLMNGQGSPGGAINMILKRPFDDFRSELSLEGGSWRHKRGTVDISSPLNDQGTVRGRLVAAGQNSNSFIERLKEKRQVFYGVLEADLGERTLARGGISYQKNHYTDHSNGALPAYASDGERIIWDRSASAAASWAYSKRSATSVFGELEHELENAWRLKVSASRMKTFSDELVGYAGRGNPDRKTGAGVGIWATHWEYEPIQYMGDVSATGPFQLFGREHEAALGLSWSKSTFTDNAFTNWQHANWDGQVKDIFTWDGNYPYAPKNPAIGTHGLDERNKGAYASVHFKPTDALSIITGARYMDWRRDQTSYRIATGLNTVTRRSEQEVVPYVGVLYDFLPNWTAYVSYTTIFTPQNYKTINGSYIEPLDGRSYELGVKSELFDGVNFSAAVYELKENNKAIAIVNSFAPDGSQAYEAKSGTKTRGFELEIAGSVTSQLDVAASYSHNQTKDRERVQINTQVPKDMIKLFAVYKVNRLDNLVVGGGARWQNSTYAVNQGPKKATFRQPSYFVVDVMAKYDFTKHLSASLNVQNLFDKHYYTNAGSSYYGRPRSVMLSVSSQF